MKILLLLILFCILSLSIKSQDTINNSGWSFHLQNTVVYQQHGAFHSSYSGQNSLNEHGEEANSVSSTIYLGRSLWKDCNIYFNPEISTGNGFSGTKGIAGFTNGEAYRLSHVSQVYIARFYINQIIPLSNDYKQIDDDVNQVEGKIPTSYLSFNIGKFSLMDFFDNNSISHDPRTQFLNWSLMSNGAYDYGASTQGYIWGLESEFVKEKYTIRLGITMVPTTCNGMDMDYNILRSNTINLEYEYRYKLLKNDGIIRILGYTNSARMGSYQEAINIYKRTGIIPSVDSTSSIGRTKFGVGINIEQNINDNISLFSRIGFNDGKNESWMFAEISQTFSLGCQINGNLWNRKTDKLGIATVYNGISKVNREYLSDGGYGFMIGDGKLNYKLENIIEVYYSYRFLHHPLWLSPSFQYVTNPGYNQDRGPITVFTLRLHSEY